MYYWFFTTAVVSILYLFVCLFFGALFGVYLYLRWRRATEEWFNEAELLSDTTLMAELQGDATDQLNTDATDGSMDELNTGSMCEVATALPSELTSDLTEEASTQDTEVDLQEQGTSLSELTEIETEAENATDTHFVIENRDIYSDSDTPTLQSLRNEESREEGEDYGELEPLLQLDSTADETTEEHDSSSTLT